MSTPITSALIARSREGDDAAQSQLIAAIYPELRRLGRRYLSTERDGHTLQTTDLVHEAWVRLFKHGEVSYQDRAHLFALMARQMRRVLVDYARRRSTIKGDGGLRVSLQLADQAAIKPDEDVLVIDEALSALEAVDARASQIVELRFFGGLLEEETAAAMGVSLSTLRRDWAFARAWLYDRLQSPG